MVRSTQVIFGLLIIFLLHLTVNGHSSEVSSFLPDDETRVLPSGFANSDVTKEDFDEVIARVKKYYGPIVAKKIGKLLIQPIWSSDIVNAYAQRVGPLYTITIHGGVAKAPFMTKDGLSLVLCHELGHHLGGAPRSKKFLNKWSALEGQADYFSTVRCLRRIFEQDDNSRMISNREIDAEAVYLCDSVYENSERSALCKRIAMAGVATATMMAQFKDDIPLISLNTPDKTVVKEMVTKHPSSQCRLDTYFQGALCDKPLSSKISKWNPNSGAFCSGKSWIGTRPLCWFVK